MACTWFGEISSCSCLTVLPGPAWVHLSKIYKHFAGSLYSFLETIASLILNVHSKKVIGWVIPRSSRGESPQPSLQHLDEYCTRKPAKRLEVGGIPRTCQRHGRDDKRRSLTTLAHNNSKTALDGQTKIPKRERALIGSLLSSFFHAALGRDLKDP